MESQEYWKDKRIGRRQVLYAWVIMIVLALGAQCAEMTFRVLSIGLETSTLAATAVNDNPAAGSRSQSLRQAD